MLIVKDFRLNTYIMTLKVTFISIYMRLKSYIYKKIYHTRYPPKHYHAHNIAIPPPPLNATLPTT